MSAPVPAPSPPLDCDSPGEPPVEATTRVLRQFRIVFNAIKTHFRQAEKAVGLGGAQIWALSTIEAAPGMGLNDLARAMDIHQSTASNLVKVLLERELITNSKSAPDRRSICLHLTEQGSAILQLAPRPFSGVLPHALASLDADTLQRMEQDLACLITALKADEAGAGILLADQ